jgi:hypothetical protein
LQDTTVTFLTAALASRNSEASTSVSNVGSSVEQSSSSMVVPSPSTDEHVQSEEAEPVVISEVIEEKKDHECIVEVTIIGVVASLIFYIYYLHLHDMFVLFTFIYMDRRKILNWMTRHLQDHLMPASQTVLWMDSPPHPLK